MSETTYFQLPIEESPLKLRVNNNTRFSIEAIERLKNARFLGVFPIKGGNFPFLVFYQEEPHTRGSNYFAVYLPPFSDTPYITDAKEVEGRYHPAFISKDGVNVVYSAYRHDFQSDQGDTIDGGLDYLKTNVKEPERLTNIVIRNGKIYLDNSSEIE